MKMTRIVSTLAMTLGCSLSSAGAATLAQYTFEDNPAGTSSSVIGTTIADSSGNGLDIVKTSAFGSVTWSSDVSSVQAAGTTSLFDQAGRGLDTAITDFSFATHGALTVEFWFKPNLASTIQYIADTGDGANTWALFQEVPGTNGAPAGEFNLEFAHIDDGGTTRSVNTAKTFSATSDWTHIAITVDLTSGQLAIYFDGVEDAATLGDEDLDALTYGSTSQVFRVGAQNSAGGFTENMYIDDLRISDVALTAGSGTGVNELAYNASLIPEPATLGLFGLGVGLMLFRR